MPEASPVETPVGCPEEARRIRSRTRWGYGGFGFGLLVMAVRVAKVGYGILPFALVWNLIWAPWLGTVMGLTHSRTRRPGPRPWPQLRTRTLMAVVAYVALLLGVGIPGRLR